MEAKRMELEVMKAKANLAKKLVTILGEMQTVKKSGKNSHQGYQYTTEADLLEVIRPKLVEQGIFVFSSVESQSRVDNITEVTMIHTFMDSETGAEFTVKSQGQGADKQDKGVYKAITGATKYFLWKNFMIETGDDPENDGANPSYVRGGGNAKKNNSGSGKQMFGSKGSPEKTVEEKEAEKTVEASPEPEPETQSEEVPVPPEVTEEDVKAEVEAQTQPRQWGNRRGGEQAAQQQPPQAKQQNNGSGRTFTNNRSNFMGHAGEPKF